jgi:hypothetical protein
MGRNILAALSALALLSSAGIADAKPCRDAKGKFVKCEKKAAPKKPCRDAKGKFTKCK